MQVTCEKCSKAINIPDEKVPQGQAFNLTCPSCKTKNRVDQHLKPAEPAGDDDGGSAMDTMFMVTDEVFEDDDDVEIYDENDKIALIMDPRNYDQIAKILTDLGYKLQTGKSPEHGVHKLKFFQYHVVVVHENFGGKPMAESPLFEYLTNMSMTTRRKTFVSLIGSKFKSTDNMQAYANSVNQVVNEKDMDKLDVMLKKGIKENDMFYRVYRETMEVLGKI